MKSVYKKILEANMHNYGVCIYNVLIYSLCLRVSKNLNLQPLSICAWSERSALRSFSERGYVQPALICQKHSKFWCVNGNLNEHWEICMFPLKCTLALDTFDHPIHSTCEKYYFLKMGFDLFVVPLNVSNMTKCQRILNYYVTLLY